jgi:hypothetical protein
LGQVLPPARAKRKTSLKFPSIGMQRKLTKQTKLNAWLLTWEGTSGPAVQPDKKIIAIVDARRSESFIEALVDVLYCRSVDSAYDMAFMANKRQLRERQYRHLNTYPSRILYGRLPCIYARRVHDLEVAWNEEHKTEHIRWTEEAIFGNAKSGASIVEIVPSRECEHVRSHQPLALDIYEREL